MSESEINRFQDDVRTDLKLAERVRAGGFGIGAIAITAQAAGYDFDVSELKALVAGQSQGMLSDEQLASVAAAGSTWTATSTMVATATVTAITIVVLPAGVIAG